MSIDRILAAAGSTIWAIEPGKLSEIVAFLQLRADGVRFSAEEIEARIGPGRTGESAGQQGGMVAVIPVFGILSQRANMMSAISGPGGTSTEQAGAQLRHAMASPEVRSILLEIDSPGGAVNGIQELAEEIYRAKDRKPVVAQVNSVACSAAYWLASSAGEIVMTPGGTVGSIGVYGTHDDLSAAAAKAGVKKTFVSAGAYKTEGNAFEPLSDEARAYMQGQVNEVYQAFVGAVARGRKTTSARVKAEFGQGRTVLAREAVRVGMVDRVGTMQDTLRRMVTSAAAGQGRQALTAPGLSATAPGSATEREAFLRRRHLHRKRLC